MSLLEEKTPSPSLALIAAFVSVLTALAFGGVWAFYHASESGGVSQHVSPASAPVSAPVEGNI